MIVQVYRPGGEILYLYRCRVNGCHQTDGVVRQREILVPEKR